MKRTLIATTMFATTMFALGACASEAQQVETPNTEVLQASDVLPAGSGERAEAVFAGGCFWCVEKDFEELPGVVEAVSGYTGGETVNPTYKQVTYADTGHYEAVKVIYDPAQVSYGELLDYYWTTVDPTDADGQFCDKGDSYRTAVFATPDQMDAAMASLAEVREVKPFDAPIVTPVLEAAPFYDAEDYHQDYYKKSSLKYKFYRQGCGRDARLKRLWGDRAGEGLG